MARIKHIAIATQNADKTAKFYVEGLGLNEVAKVDSPNASGYFFSDGYINMAILNFKNDQTAGPEYGQNYSDLHHIGFEVESIEEVNRKLEEAHSSPREWINHTLGLDKDGPHHG